MAFLERLPLRRKLTVIALTAAAAALVLTCTSFVIYDVVTFRAALVRRLTTQAEIAGRQSAASLVFQDPETASTILGALGADPRLLSAAIYTPDQELFAQYARGGEQPTGAGLVVSRPIEFDGRVIGTIALRSDLAEITDRMERYAVIALVVLLVSIAVAHWIATRLQRVITEPVRRLSEAALAVSTHEDYSVRATATSDDELGRLIGTFNAMLEQIQDRDRALTASEEQYRLLFHANPHPMWVYDPASLAFAAVNDAAVRLYGYTREEFLAMTIKDIRPANEVPALLDSLAAPHLRGNGSDTVWRHLKKDGTTIDVAIASSPIEFLGQPARFVLATDVSEQRRLEAQLLQSQKMEAVGRLAGGVAHDFNNLLGVITGYSGLLGRSLAPNDAVALNRVDQIKKAAERATALTRQLLAFSRKEVIQPKVLDLNEIVHDVEKMLLRLIGEDVRLTTKLEADLGHVKADRGQIDQVMVNLAVNARDAMPNGGQLIIETANTFLDEQYARRHPDVTAGPYVVLTVSDTGHGMDEATRSHIFEPFFTTKPEGEGTGLGLATVFGIAKQSGGHINVYSEPGQGATFKFYLPRVDEALDGAVEAEAPARKQGTETLLLVEDAEALRSMIHEILVDAGYVVLEAADPHEALARAEENRGRLDLVLTDVIMPGMYGPDLVKAVQAMDPGIGAVFMSGYTNEAVSRQGVLQPGTRFIQKPFTSEVLLDAIRDALDASAANAASAAG
jgi:two-component system, cell cycle sensor histidine kinase and response regulator CckA